MQKSADLKRVMIILVCVAQEQPVLISYFQGACPIRQRELRCHLLRRNSFKRSKISPPKFKFQRSWKRLLPLFFLNVWKLILIECSRREITSLSTLQVFKERREEMDAPSLEFNLKKGEDQSISTMLLKAPLRTAARFRTRDFL